MIRTKKPKPFVVTDIHGVPVIQEPAIGSVVLHSGWAPGKSLEGYPADVFIVKGNYLVNGRLSNWWTWRKVKKDKSGNVTLGEEISGYGSFRVSKNEYDINIIIKLSKRK